MPGKRSRDAQKDRADIACKKRRTDIDIRIKEITDVYAGPAMLGTHSVKARRAYVDHVLSDTKPR